LFNLLFIYYYLLFICYEKICMEKSMRKIIFVSVFLLATGFVHAQYPVIKSLNPKAQDVAFEQYVRDVALARGLVLNEHSPVRPDAAAKTLTIYAYTPNWSDFSNSREKNEFELDLSSIAARCTIPPSTLATLNHIARQGVLDTKNLMLLPSVPGLFVPDSPSSELEKLMFGARAEAIAEARAEADAATNARAEALAGSETGAVANSKTCVGITVPRNGKSEKFWFFPGQDFNATERAFFLNQRSNFRYPLNSFTVTSKFGIRVNPVTGRVKNHDGLDLAAPSGTPVYAVQSGTVTETGNDSIYGNYIIIRHEGNWASLYGHLSKIETSLRSTIQTGQLIGRVGSTGQSTGPHLHFELRQNGRAQDPGKYLFLNNR
jgi:murein DD-endopeptidase MepM/ murein hydrolase activator NlpD